MCDNAGKLQKLRGTDTDAGYLKELQGIPASQNKTALCYVTIFCVSLQNHFSAETCICAVGVRLQCEGKIPRHTFVISDAEGHTLFGHMCCVITAHSEEV